MKVAHDKCRHVDRCCRTVRRENDRNGFAGQNSKALSLKCPATGASTTTCKAGFWALSASRIAPPSRSAFSAISGASSRCAL
jgi:hypothetical protein